MKISDGLLQNKYYQIIDKFFIAKPFGVSCFLDKNKAIELI
jgi:hypothetical protein